jgi:glutamate-1-semialdehyde 2,1-aminomutase
MLFLSIRGKLMGSSKSKELFEEAKKHVPGGGSSNVRVSEEHDPFPILFKRGQGSKVWDVDGKEYTDYLLSYGALILGHCHPKIVEAIKNQLTDATMIGTTTELEIDAAKKVCEMVPCADMVKFCTTGTEATMNAIRIARAYTGREKIVKFEGHYHGHHDYVLYSVVADPMFAGLEHAPHKLPWFPGVPNEVAKTVAVASWNDLSLLERALKKDAKEIAAIIMEPIMANNAIIVPNEGYLEGVRELTQKYDIVLIFDEVFTGFRVAKGGAQEYFDVTPDLACFSKALGGGVPIAAVAGVKDIMEMVVPGKIGFAGTYNANLLSLSACLAVLKELSWNDGEALRRLRLSGKKLADGLQEILNSTGHDGIVQSVGAMFSILFTKLTKITNYRQWITCDLEKFKQFRDLIMKKGIYLHPDGMERVVLSTVHTHEDIEKTLVAAEDTLKKLPK